MKKFIISLLFVFVAIGAHAQVTYNVRVGGGVGTDKCGDALAVAAPQIQCNIPFRKGSHFTFSPSVMLATDFCDVIHLVVPLTVGYKVKAGNNGIFFPKAGVAVGGELLEGGIIIGPAVGLDYEIKHFVVGLNLYQSGVTTEYDDYYDYYHFNHFGANLTVGYKF